MSLVFETLLFFILLRYTKVCTNHNKLRLIINAFNFGFYCNLTIFSLKFTDLFAIGDGVVQNKLLRTKSLDM
jgi:hypothetical protein